MSSKLSAPIFLLGLQASGANLIRRSLAAHPQLTTLRPSESFVDMREGSRVPISSAQVTPERLLKKLSQRPHARAFAHPAYLPLSRLTAADVGHGDFARVSTVFLAAMINPFARLVEASAPNIVRARYLQALFPDARFVAIVRNPYAFVSANAAPRTRWGAIEEQALHWSEAHDCLLLDRKKLKHCLVVRYEDLIADTGETLEKIRRHCQIDSCSLPIEHITSEAHSNEYLTSLLDDRDRWIITKACKHTMRRLGYSPLEKPSVARSRPAA